MTSYFRIGGLALEPPPAGCDRVRRFIDALPAHIDEYEDLLTNNRIWIGRTKGVGFICAEDTLDLGVTGPMLRAAGLRLRRPQGDPYSSYEKFDFEVPTRTENDCYRALSGARRGNAREPENHPPGAGKDSRRRPDQADAPGIVAAGARKDEDADGSAHLPLQDCDRRLPRRRPARSTRRSNRRAASWATTW